MTGGIDWFRWHHGSVTDPKFQLVARKSGASLPDVLAVWAYLLEKASAATPRGQIGEVDYEALDCLFNFPGTETRTANIVDAMRERRLLDGHCICAWDKRQPKREREGDTSTDRVRAFRAKENHETPRNAIDSQETPRGEEKREEIPPTLRVAPPSPKRKSPKTALPSDFGISQRVADWAKAKGYGQLDEHLDAFRRKVAANGYTAVSWDDKFMEAIREDWAKLRGRTQNGAAPPGAAPQVETWKPPPRMTDEEMAASEEARQRVMAGIKRIGRAA